MCAHAYRNKWPRPGKPHRGIDKKTTLSPPPTSTPVSAARFVCFFYTRHHINNIIVVVMTIIIYYNIVQRCFWIMTLYYCVGLDLDSRKCVIQPRNTVSWAKRSFYLPKANTLNERCIGVCALQAYVCVFVFWNPNERNKLLSVDNVGAKIHMTFIV